MSARGLLAPLLAGLAVACTSPPDAPPRTLADGRYTMGTVLEVTLHGPDAQALARARDRIFALAEALDARLSSYRETSDVSRLNAASGGPALVVHDDVWNVLRASVRYAELTRGSFDVTIGPLVSLWIDAAARDRIPGEREVESARRRVDATRILLGEGGRVALPRGATIDLGGVAKGYALDRMLPVLREEGVTSALLSFGQSSVWAVGAPPGAEGWRLLARSPDGGFAGLLTLRDQALSVSGSLGQWSEIGGRRFGHVIDPRSGWPLTRRRQAIVVGKDAALAEALSKALLILGEAEGLPVVGAQPDSHALLLDVDGSRHATPGFDTHAGYEALPADPT